MTPTREKTKTILLAATALMLNYGSALAQSQPAGQPPQQQATAAQADAFKRFDLDKDSYIDQKEASLSAALTQIFDTADTNHDGKLNLSEFTQALAKQSK